MSRTYDEVSVSLSPGMVITLGGVHKFRFNHPAEAALLRERRRVGDDQLKINYDYDGNHGNTDDEQIIWMLWLM